MRESFETPNRNEEFDEKNALLPAEEQKELNSLRIAQVEGELSSEQRERLLELQAKEERVKEGEDVLNEEEEERYKNLSREKEGLEEKGKGFDEKNALLPAEEQKELNSLRIAQMDGELTSDQRERLVELQNREEKAKKARYS